MSLFIAFRKEWMESLRSYRLLIVAIVLAFFGLTSPLFAKMMPELLKILPTGGITIQMPTPTVGDAVSQYIKNMAQFGLILALLLTMGSIAQEKDKGTAAMMLVKPLPKGAFIGAKFLGLIVIFAISFAIAALGAYYYTLVLFGALDMLNWLMLNGLLLLYTLVYVAITLCCSTLTKSQVAAGGAAIIIFIVLGSMGSLGGLGKYLPGELVTWGTRIMNGDTTASWPALGVSVGLIVISLLGGWLVFRRQEL